MNKLLNDKDKKCLAPLIENQEFTVIGIDRAAGPDITARWTHSRVSPPGGVPFAKSVCGSFRPCTTNPKGLS